MSSSTITIIGQIISMFILIGIGYTLHKLGILSKVISKSLSDILINLTIPIVIFLSFNKPYNSIDATNLLISFVFSIIAHLLFILTAQLLLKDPIDKNIVAIPNSGFMGIPLVSAIVGEYAIFYISAYMVVNSIVQWTYGYNMLSPHNKLSLKKLFLSPLIISILISLFVYFVNIQIPSIVTTPLTYLGNMNTPLAMLVLGSFLASSNIKDHLYELKKNLPPILIRLILLPLICVLLGFFVGKDLDFLRRIILILSASPAAISVALFTEKAKLNSNRASVLICLSTLLSLFTIPIILELAISFWSL